jgi:long-chain acyl-CoA synthetase
MTEYFHPDTAMAEKATKHTIRAGWFYTGEIARLETPKDGEPSFKIVGRSDEVLRQGNTYLSPGRLDDTAKEISGVLDAAGFVRLSIKGEQTLGCAVVKSNKNLTEEEVLKHFASRVAPNLQPKSVHFIEELPKDSFENVLRHTLQRLFSES